ncbi:MAG: hypothetical protein ACWA5P_06475 [bacterium]
MNKWLSHILMLLSTISCVEQNSDWINRTKHEGLYTLQSTTLFEVYCTEPQPKNIDNTVDNLKQAKKYFDNIFNEDLNFAVLFIDNQNWNKYAFAPPPGMPQAYHDGNIVLGFGQSIMNKRWTQKLNTRPVINVDSLKTHFGEDLNLDLFFRDALSLHELGHVYQFYRTSKQSQRRWLNEVFGNLCQVAAAHNLKNRECLHRMDYFQNLLIKENLWGNINYKTLDQFENEYFNIINQGSNYGWYQTQFYFIAKKLYLRFGDEFLNDLRNFLIEVDPKKIGILDNHSLNEKMSNTFGQEVIQIMKWKYNE